MLELSIPGETPREQYQALYKEDPIEAVKRDRLYLLIYLKSIGAPLDQKLADQAVISGRLQILKWLVANGLTLKAEMLPEAIENGHLNIAQYLLEQGFFPLEEYYNLIIEETEYDFMDKIADWLYELGIVPLDWRILDCALKDKIYFLDWLNSKDFLFDQDLINRIMFDSADLATEWFLENNMPPSQNFLDNMIWLKQIGTFSILEKYYYYPSSTGYLFCLFTNNLILFKRMLRNSIPLYHQITQYAILLNRPSFLKIYSPEYTLTDRLYAELSDTPTDFRIVFAEAPKYTPGMLEVKGGIFPQERLSPIHADLAMAYGHEKLVKEFASIGIYPTDVGYTSAATKGYPWAFKFMISQNHQPDELTLFMALHYENIEIIKYLVQNQVQLNEFLLDVVAAYGYLDLLKWLAQNYNLIPTALGASHCMRRGNYDVLKYLIEIDPLQEPSYYVFKYPIIWRYFPREQFINQLGVPVQ